MAVARIFLHNAPEFDVAAIPYPGMFAGALFVLLGICAGVAAVAYNRLLLLTLGVSDGFKRLPMEVRAAAIGAIVGLVAWLAPDFVGGGESLAQQSLDGSFTGVVLATVFLLRFIMGPVSYASATPGGLFAPILVLGAQLGLVFFAGCHVVFPHLDTPADAFAIVSMAALFTGIVRAPVTGIVLITEMTGSFTLLLPMLAACFTAMLIPTLFNDPPIYTSLSEIDTRTARSAKEAGPELGAAG